MTWESIKIRDILLIEVKTYMFTSISEDLGISGGQNKATMRGWGLAQW
jgi:hypothetical protein